MKKLKTVIIILSIVMALCIAGAIYLLQPKEIIYDLIVEPEVSMFKDEEYKIDVKLIDQEGKQYEGKYSFESTNTDLVNVDDEGNVSINESSSIINYEDVYVNIKEVNNNVVKRVKINIIFDLKDVFDFSSVDNSEDNFQSMVIGRTYMFEVSTLPRDFAIEDYFSLKTYDFEGNQKDIFTTDFNKNVVSLTPEGIGNGKFIVNIINEHYDLNFEKEIQFKINYYNESFTEDILNSSEQKLLSKQDLKNMSELYISSNHLLIDEDFIKTFDLSKIKTIVLLKDEVCNIEYVDDTIIKNNLKNIIYRVPSNQFMDYLNNENWDFLSYNIIPYDSELLDYNVKYIVYHYSVENDSEDVFKNDFIVFEKANENSLSLFATYEGYTQASWKDQNNNIIESLTNIEQGIHLFAEWKANEYSILLNGSDLIENQEIKVQYNGTYNLPKYNSINGWVFEGWYTESTFENEYKIAENYIELNDTTLYAKWSTSIVLDYDGNNINGESNESISDIVYGSEVTLPNLDTTREWEFAGWYTDKSGRGTKVESGSYTISGNITLYAKWTYDLQLEYLSEEFEVEGLSDSIQLINGLTLDEISCSLPNNYMVDDNWTLESWYTNENHQGKILTNSEIIKIENFVNYETGEKLIDTVYALYTSNAYFMDGDTLLHSIKIKYNEVVNPHVDEYDSKATKEGYEFLTWNCTDNEGTTLIYMWYYQGPGKDAIPDRSWTIKCEKRFGNMIFTPEYRANKYNVIFDLQGGEVDDYSLLNLNVEYDSGFSYPTNPTKQGYTFVEWKLVSVDGEIRNEILEEEELINLTSVNKAIVKFEAVWEANTYKFLLNGNELVSDTETNIAYNQEIKLDDLGTVGIWNFAGWYIDKEYNQKVSNICTYLYEDGKDYIELYSKWTTSLTFDYAFEAEESLVIENVVYGKDVEINGLLNSVEGWTINGWYSQESGLGTQLVFDENDSKIVNYNYSFNTVYPKLEYETVIKYDHLGIAKNGTWEDKLTLTKGLSFDENRLPNILGFEDETFQASWTLFKWTSDVKGVNIIDSTTIVNEIIPYVYPHFESKITLVSNINDGIEEEITINLGSKINIFTKEILNTFDSDYRRAFYAWKYDDITITEVNFESKGYNIVTKDMANREYIALYKDGMYTIKYIYTKNNGQNVSVLKKYSLAEEQFITLEAAQKEGYTFIAWQLDEDMFNAETSYDTLANTIGEIIVMNAIWEENQYTINYVVSEGLEEISQEEVKYSEYTEIKSISEEKTGYIFVGWSMSEGRSQVDFKASEKVNKLSTINDSIVNLYDCFVPITYYINLCDSEGNLIERVEKLYTDEEFVLCSMERQGYDFITWRDENLTNLSLGVKINKLDKDQAEINIYGIWNEHEYTVNVYNESDLIKTTSLKYSDQIKVLDLLSGNIEKFGYNFNSLVDAEGNEYLLNQIICSLTETNNEEINLYIKWKPIEFNVYFEDYNDSITLIYQINYEQKFGDINHQLGLPTEEIVYKENFNFQGWYLDKDYTNLVTRDTLISDIVTTDNIEEFINNNYRMNLYAKYTSQLILKEANGIAEEKVEIIYGEEINLPLYDIKNNWKFNGWYLNTNYYDFEKIGIYENDEIKYLVNDQSGNLELYAKWTANINLYTFKEKKIDALSKSNFRLIYGWKVEDIFEYNNFKTNPLNFTLEKGWELSFVDDLSNIQYKYQSDSIITNVSDLYVDYECKVMFKKNTKSSNVTDQVKINLNWMSFDGDLKLDKINLSDLCLDSIETETGYTSLNWSYVNNNNITKNIALSVGEISYENGLANSSISMVFQANKYTIYFDPGSDGTVGATSLEVTYDETYANLPKANKYGYDNFTGYKSPRWQVNDTIVNSDSIVKITSDMTIQPYYMAKKVTISFNADGGSVSVSSRSYYFNETCSFPYPTKTNNAFVCWSYNGKQVTSLGTSNGVLSFAEDSATLVAVWTPIYSFVEFSSSNGLRDKTLNSGGSHADTVYPYFDRELLKSLGYRYIVVDFKFQKNEKANANPTVVFYSYHSNPNTLYSGSFRKAGTAIDKNWSEVIVRNIKFDINETQVDGSFWVKFSAPSGIFAGWTLGYTSYTIKASKS